VVFAALPETMTEFAYRADSALYEHGLLNWFRGEGDRGSSQVPGLLRDQRRHVP
jgi:hypothetical protein